MHSDRKTVDPIPALTPEREEVALHRPRPGRNGGGRAAPRRELSGNWLLLALCLLAVVGLGAWNYSLHEQLQAAESLLTDAGARLYRLEQRLSITDESMNQSSDVMDVRLKELDTEVRKLWDNVWKRAKQQLVQHDKEIKSLKSQVEKQAKLDAGFKATLAETTLAVDALESEVNNSSRLEGQLTKLGVHSEVQDESIMEMADSVAAMEKATERMEKRIAGAEEWVDSFNGYRTQMNRKILDLQGSIKALQE